jgi:hypothetical protein
MSLRLTAYELIQKLRLVYPDATPELIAVQAYIEGHTDGHKEASKKTLEIINATFKIAAAKEKP